MRRNSLLWAVCGVAALMISASLVATSQMPDPARQPGESAIRLLMSNWVTAYKNLDAKRLAALEVPNVEVIDRFGDLHQPTGRAENERLWSDTFDVISRSTEPPKATINHIRFLEPDVALVQMSWEFAGGILLTDGTRIPPYSQIDIYVVTKSGGKWLVAAHYMQEVKS